MPSPSNPHGPSDKGVTPMGFMSEFRDGAGRIAPTERLNRLTKTSGYFPTANITIELMTTMKISVTEKKYSISALGS